MDHEGGLFQITGPPQILHLATLFSVASTHKPPLSSRQVRQKSLKFVPGDGGSLNRPSDTTHRLGFDSCRQYRSVDSKLATTFASLLLRHQHAYIHLAAV